MCFSQSFYSVSTSPGIAVARPTRPTLVLPKPGWPVGHPAAGNAFRAPIWKAVLGQTPNYQASDNLCGSRHAGMALKTRHRSLNPTARSAARTMQILPNRRPFQQDHDASRDPQSVNRPHTISASIARPCFPSQLLGSGPSGDATTPGSPAPNGLPTRRARNSCPPTSSANRGPQGSRRTAKPASP